MGFESLCAGMFFATMEAIFTTLLLIGLVGTLVLLVAGLVGILKKEKTLTKPPAVFTDFENEVLSRMRNLPDFCELNRMYNAYCASGEDVVDWVDKNVKNRITEILKTEPGKVLMSPRLGNSLVRELKNRRRK